jgi:hypothetical protein
MLIVGSAQMIEGGSMVGFEMVDHTGPRTARIPVAGVSENRHTDQVVVLKLYMGS